MYSIYIRKSEGKVGLKAIAKKRNARKKQKRKQILAAG